MGTYHPNLLGVVRGKVGRELQLEGEASYAGLTAQLEEGEGLWVLAVQGFPVVMLIPHQEEFNYVMSLVAEKGPYKFYAIPLPAHP